jgi:prolipoprotein diacylglyceryltransferase
MMDFLSTNSAAITALATVVIAIFSFMTWLASHRIRQASLLRDKEVNELYLNLVAAIIASSRLAGEGKLASSLFKSHKEELRKLFLTE